MNRYTIWVGGTLMGTYSGTDETAAYEALKKEDPNRDWPKLSSGKVIIEQVQ